MGILDHPSSSGTQPTPSRSGIDWAKWFPPVTSRNFLSYYLPASGALSHTLYTVHLFSPNIISSVFPTGDLAVSNTILFNANVGLGFYVYFRRHLNRVNPWERVEFSVLASTLFNFGSLLAAVLIKALVPAKTHTWLKSLVATTLSVYLVSRAYRYMGLLDTRTSRASVSPSRSLSSPKSRKMRASTRSIASCSSSRAASVYSADISNMASENGNGYENGTYSNHQQHQLPMTPSATNYSATEAGLTNSEYGQDDENGMGEKLNYRYLHSFALNNLNQAGPGKENIIRRTTNMKRRQSGSAKTHHHHHHHPETPLPTYDIPSFVTPEPSLKGAERVEMYTPPPSRASSEKGEDRKEVKRPRKRVRIAEKEDGIDRMIDMIQWHAPIAVIPIAFGCFVTGTVPMINTIRFIFSH